MPRRKPTSSALSMPVSTDVDTFQDMPTTTAYGVSAAEAVLLTPTQAARRLGIRTTTLYGWLGAIRVGAFIMHGAPFSLRFLQTGPAGQGRILIEAVEVERLREHMYVQPRPVIRRRPPTVRIFPGIHVPLGRPRPGG